MVFPADAGQLRFVANNSGCWAASTPQEMEMVDVGTGGWGRVRLVVVAVYIRYVWGTCCFWHQIQQGGYLWGLSFLWDSHTSCKFKGVSSAECAATYCTFASRVSCSNLLTGGLKKETRTCASSSEYSQPRWFKTRTSVGKLQMRKCSWLLCACQGQKLLEKAPTL